MANKQTVLIVGATGNIGVSAVLAALKSHIQVLAIVRNKASAEKMFTNVGTRDGIISVEADILSPQGVQGVVDQVKAGKLPSFQHVYSCSGGYYSATPLTELSLEEWHEAMKLNFETNFFAYRATIPYLKSLGSEDSTWTLCTGSQGDLGYRAAPGMTQGALFSMAKAACRDTADTNIRFNEVYLDMRVEVDAIAEKNSTVKSSEFAVVYEELLRRKNIKSSRVRVRQKEDFKNLKLEQIIHA